MRHLTLALLLLLAACGDEVVPTPPPTQASLNALDPGPVVTVVRAVMGTEARINVYTEDREAGFAAANKALDEIERLDRVLSDYKPDSELMKLCAAPNDKPTPVSQELYDALSMALGLAQRTRGLYDPTVGAYTHLWRKAKAEGAPPSRKALDEAKARVGWQKVELHPPTRSVRLTEQGMQLDLGGFGKGYAAQMAWAVLGMEGFPACLVDLGGDIVVGDAPEGQPGWIVGLENGPSLVLRNCGVASSGPGDRAWVHKSVSHGHILDARTGRAITNEQVSIVIAPDAASADVLATVLCILPATEGISFAEGATGIEARVRLTDHSEHATSGFAALQQR